MRSIVSLRGGSWDAERGWVRCAFRLPILSFVRGEGRPPGFSVLLLVAAHRSIGVCYAGGHEILNKRKLW